MKLKHLVCVLVTLVSCAGHALGQENAPALPGPSFYLTVSGGGAMPSDLLLGIQQDALNAQAAFGILLALGDFELGLGGTTGVRYFRTVQSVAYPYYMLSFPLAAQARLTTKFALPINIFIETSLGLAWNSVIFPAGDPNRNTVLLYGNFLAGFGMGLGPNVTLSQYFGFTLIMFKDPVYFSIDPGVRLEVRF